MKVGFFPRVRVASFWILRHATRVWPFLLLAVVLTLSWQTLHQVHTRDFRAALRGLDLFWIGIAAVVTAANVAVMGLYDVVAFRHTRTTVGERWRYGAVAFAWSNFLTLGPVAGPAIRFWLYRSAVDHVRELQSGVVAIAIAFASGLAGWALAVWMGTRLGVSGPGVVIGALALTAGIVGIASPIAARLMRREQPRAILSLAFVGWLDWLCAAIAFTACMRATGLLLVPTAMLPTFFFGQVLGLVSLVPGGLGTSDMFWIAHLPFAQSVSAAALMAYRFVYYVGPWLLASLLLLAWATRRTSARLDIARRVVAVLVGGAAILIILSSASPALHARFVILHRLMPLPLVEAGETTAALSGLLLLVLARGLRQGYRLAYRATVALLLIAATASIAKGLDWEETLVLAGVAAAAWSQGALFNRPSRRDWLEGRDLFLAFGALAMFLLFGVVSYHLSPAMLTWWASVGHGFQRALYLRTAISMIFVVSAVSLYVALRAPVRFERPAETDVARALALHAAHGSGTTPLMVATGDKSIFFDGSRGFCLYRTMGPYLAVFSDPTVGEPSERAAFVEALFAFADSVDRRPLFYQISLDWLPLLHDRGCHFFKLGEEAHVHLDSITLDGHAGKPVRQILRRGERDGAAFRILDPHEIAPRLAELREISDEWLLAKGVSERQFSIGAFDNEYLQRFRCAVVEEATTGRILAFANLLEGRAGDELSVDLMRSRNDGPRVMDFLLMSLFLEGKRAGYARFNLGMAPLASVGERSGAHIRERLARLLFQRGEHWYNFQGVRFYKQKFDPEWRPRYMAYQHGWEWAVATASVSALITGTWSAAPAPQPEGTVAVTTIANPAAV